MTSLVVALIGLGGVNFVFLLVSPKVITTFPMLPDLIPYSESESLLLLQCFRLLGVFFLDHLLELVHFLALLRKRLLCGIGFLSAFLSGAEIGFFRSVFLEMTAFTRIVRCVHALMLIARLLCFSVQAFWDCGQYQVATYLFYCCAKVSRRKKRRTFRILPGHIRAL